MTDVIIAKDYDRLQSIRRIRVLLHASLSILASMLVKFHYLFFRLMTRTVLCSHRNSLYKIFMNGRESGDRHQILNGNSLTTMLLIVIDAPLTPVMPDDFN